ncbi:MAG: hypothetical protein NWE75_00345 [Candidatus Bathyarchaeota archaeon]|nr:hypothetical protein [Candidatus Bathyarchaeota archaeon]
MMLGHKPYTYAVIAIAIGYLLISVVPGQLTPMRLETFEAERPGEPAVEEETLQEEPLITTEEEELGEDVSAATASADAAKTAADEARTAVSGLTFTSGVFGAFGNLLISLVVAFSVYWITRRRFV